jgi:hypothetical protein
VTAFCIRIHILEVGLYGNLQIEIHNYTLRKDETAIDIEGIDALSSLNSREIKK